MKQGGFAKVEIVQQKNIVKRVPKKRFLIPVFLKEDQFIQKNIRSIVDPQQEITKKLLNLDDQKKEASIFGYAGKTIVEEFLDKKPTYQWKKVKQAFIHFAKRVINLTRKAQMIYGDPHMNNICFDGLNFFFIDNGSWMTYYAYINQMSNFFILKWLKPPEFLNASCLIANGNIGKLFRERFYAYRKDPLFWLGYVDPDKLVLFQLGMIFYYIYESYNTQLNVEDTKIEGFISNMIHPDPRKRFFDENS